MTIRHQRNHGYYEVRQRIQERRQKRRVAAIWYVLAALALLAVWFVFASGLFQVTW